jgi:hypothetical protein
MIVGMAEMSSTIHQSWTRFWRAPHHIVRDAKKLDLLLIVTFLHGRAKKSWRQEKETTAGGIQGA